MTQLIRPYDREGSTSDLITPRNVHAWVADGHTELEWQARERVLVDQQADAAVEWRLQAQLTLIGAWVVLCMSAVCVLAFSLTYRILLPDGSAAIGPWWLEAVGILAAVLIVAGLVAVWFGATDWHRYRTSERIAERSLREHHLAYAVRG